MIQSFKVNSANGQSSCSSGCREMIRAHCFGDKGADTDSVSVAKAAQFHSSSRNVFSSVSVMVHLMFLCCGFCDRRMPVIILLCENKTDCRGIRLVRLPAHKPESSNYHHPDSAGLSYHSRHTVFFYRTYSFGICVKPNIRHPSGVFSFSLTFAA